MFKLMVAVAALLVGVLPCAADQVHVAVAANFTKVAEQLADDFAKNSGHEVMLSFGATGQLYAQISQAAPFDVFLSADTARVEKAIAEGHGVAGTNFVYALGRLALYAPGLETGEAPLKGDFQKLAIADPKSAPYGAAAVETLEALELYEVVADRLVQGENITQTLQFVETGSAELGFVALSQVIGKDDVWVVPSELYSPIAQGAVLLSGAKDKDAAEAFLAYLRGAAAVAVIEAAGYSVE
ncbi:molybdate ABC transporter substrate-binding protein [Devosia sp. MC532]|uniref:molybdate ABC transporter substrate-binding protein n=1 Tax=Devosia sp. MC532 TaxID=2799788 RepID=UPI0018F4A38B|nr:molybdate ABC transporter substrate-binding protein [Devosia sp. MC532]MBJ7578403.1 molybdate ABC transporter substrate-binding protein [Devosia sp. MC532]